MQEVLPDVERAILEGDVEILIDLWKLANIRKDDVNKEKIQDAVPRLTERYKLNKGSSFYTENLKELSFPEFVKLYDHVKIKKFLEKGDYNNLYDYIDNHGSGIALEALQTLSEFLDHSNRCLTLPVQRNILVSIILKLNLSDSQTRELANKIFKSICPPEEAERLREYAKNKTELLVFHTYGIVTVYKAIPFLAQTWLMSPTINFKNFLAFDAFRSSIYSWIEERYGKERGAELVQNAEAVEKSNY